MSVQSEINRINGEVDTQEELIEQIRSVLKGKSKPSSGRTKWYRPSDMPDYDTLIPDKSIFEDDYPGQTYINCFYTIATRIPGYNLINPDISGGDFYLGHFENGIFIKDEKVAMPLDISGYEEEFLILHQSYNASMSNTRKPFSFALSSGGPNRARAPIVEIYGRVSSGNMSGSYSYNAWALPTCKYITLWGTLNFGSLTSSGRPRFAEYVDLSHTTIPDIAGRFYATSAFQECSSIKCLIFPSNRTIATLQEYGLQYARFNNCASLMDLDVSMFDMNGITSYSNMFANCISLQTLDISNWDMTSATGMSNTFANCYNLTNLICKDTVFPSISFAVNGSNYLTVESMLGIFNGLPSLEEGKAATLTLGATNLAKLTDGEKLIATSKGWTLA